MTLPSPTRPTSPTDQLADRYVTDLCALDPALATFVGAAGHDEQLTDYSPDAVDERAALGGAVLAQLESLRPVDEVDRVGAAAMRERLGVEAEIHSAGMLYGPLNVIESPAQTIRLVFDLMPTATAQDWDTIATRLTRVPGSVDSYLQGLRRRVADGRPPARRQVEAVAAQCERQSDPASGFFAGLVASARPDGGEPPAALAERLRAGAAAAAEAYTTLATALRTELLPGSSAEDAVGADAYALWSRYFLGATVDLAETYAWGQEELARIEAEMADVAGQVVPGGSVEDAIAALDRDPARTISGGEAFRDWMQELSDRTLADLADVHFDIPPPVRRLECRIAPTQEGGIYYTPPSEDFTRPGRMWWSVPQGVTTFSTWQETTTVFHEGVPGHHLQIAQTLYRAELLNRWRRVLCWVSGHGEGWALYAERLMADLGRLDDPGDRLGMLDSQRFRAMRVVVDLGVHCGFDAPAEIGGGAWDVDGMWRFMQAHCRVPAEFLRFEQLRYLGWPGQAPSYKVGERLWLRTREAVRQREGESFDLKEFHRRALDVGSVGLDVLHQALLR